MTEWIKMKISQVSTLKRRHLERSSGGADAGNMIPEDRISSLPESIICHILSLLPTKSAVATSFLSKSWKSRWTTVTAFNFNDREWPNRERSVPETRGAAVPAMDFVEFVNRVFISHSEPIHKLRLRWQSCNIRSVYLNIWLYSAIARNFRVLDLATFPERSLGTLRHSDENYEFDLPAGLYTCRTLEVLKLRGPIKIKLPHEVHLPKLAVMELVCVKFESEKSVAELISACSMLEKLRIERHHHHGDLLVCKVSSPSLKRLEICFYRSCELCNPSESKLVIDTPSLEYVYIDSSMLSEITCIQRTMPVNEVEFVAVYIFSGGVGIGNGVAELLQACSGDVKVLTLCERSMLSLCLSETDTPLPASFRRLTRLVVEVTRTYWSNLMDLMERCVDLQVLDITIDDNMVDDGEAEWLLETYGCSFWQHPDRVPACLSSSLKRVYFRSFEGLEDEMAMLKFLLDHGSLLERVALSSNTFVRSSFQQKLNTLNEVSMLSRASATCKISLS